jgi:putative transposase
VALHSTPFPFEVIRSTFLDPWILVARGARFVAPGPPRHVTRRGNRRETVFFSDADHELYRDLLAERTRKHGVEVWSHCPMPDHVHLFLVQTAREGLGRALGEARRRRGAVVNARPRVTGHLFQSRFGSVAMDEAHLMAAARYVARNPVRARLVARADDWRWSSARAHLQGRDDGLATVQPLLDRRGGRFADLIDALPPLETTAALRAAETIGRPLGSDAFLAGLVVLEGARSTPTQARAEG